MQKNRQVNLRPGLQSIALHLQKKQAESLRGVVRVLNTLTPFLRSAYAGDDDVLQKEYDHFVADLSKEKKHPDAEHHNRVSADLSSMVQTILNMADDNVIAVSTVDCARVFANALISAEDILSKEKPAETYRQEALGMVDAVCELMHPDSYFPELELKMLDTLRAELRSGHLKSIHLLRTHLEKIG